VTSVYWHDLIFVPHRISPDVRSGYSNVRVTCHIETDASRDQIAELCEYAQEHSPVFDIVANPVAVSVELAD